LSKRDAVSLTLECSMPVDAVTRYEALFSPLDGDEDIPAGEE
jgi:hypothetical protein